MSKVKVKKLRLEDMTKEELICLFRRHVFRFDELDLMGVRADHLGDAAMKLSLEALQEQAACSLPQDYKKWKKAQAKFEKGMRMHDESSAYYEALSRMREARRNGDG